MSEITRQYEEICRLRKALEDIATGFGGLVGSAYEMAVRKHASDALDAGQESKDE